MGRDRKRWIYAINLERQQYRIVRVYNDLGVNFNVMVLAIDDQQALKYAELNEPGYKYENTDIRCHRLFIPDYLITK